MNTTSEVLHTHANGRLWVATPGVVIDGKVMHAGGVPNRKKVEGWF